jgi:hypothetical protein
MTADPAAPFWIEHARSTESGIKVHKLSQCVLFADGGSGAQFVVERWSVGKDLLVQASSRCLMYTMHQISKYCLSSAM